MEREQANRGAPGRAHPLIVVGDLLVDELVGEGGESVCYAGGAGYNTAVDLADMGFDVDLVATVGDDALGDQLRADARRRGVRVCSSPWRGPTGVATSWRVDNEPRYAFNEGVTKRFWSFDTVGDAAPTWTVVNAYNFDAAAEVDDLLRFVDAGGHRLVVDPNARPALLADRRAYLDGVMRAAARASVVKMSEDDAATLGESIQPMVDRFHSVGVEAVVVTHGAAGASVSLRRGSRYEVEAPTSEAPVVDTMGAGDAVTAGIVAGLAQLPEISSPDMRDWPALMTRAMHLARMVISQHGGHLGAAVLCCDGVG